MARLLSTIDMERFPAWYSQQLSDDRRVAGSSVRFDGGSYVQSAAADAPTLLDGRLGTLSLWFNPLLAVTEQHIVRHLAGGITLVLNSDDTITITGIRPSGGVAFSITSAAVTIDGSWRHLMCSWDNQSATPTEHLFIDNVDAAGAVVNNDFDIAYSEITQIRFGADGAGANRYDGWIAEFWLDATAQMDLSDADLRRQFINPDMQRVDLGPFGLRPLDLKPAMYYRGGHEDFVKARGVMDILKEAPLGEIKTRVGQVIKGKGTL